ncbi:MAG: hypothetical protein ACLP1X_03805 [Polyangiaceae bacterium]
MIRALMHSIGDLAKEKGIDGRVASKVNARGELVIALLIPPRTPGEWADAPKPTREQKRASREAR